MILLRIFNFKIHMYKSKWNKDGLHFKTIVIVTNPSIFSLYNSWNDLQCFDAQFREFRKLSGLQS